MIHITDFRVNDKSTSRVQNLTKSVCREFYVFGKGKVHAAWEVLRKRGSILDINY